MHRIHSIELSETDDEGRRAILIKLGGELDEDFEPMIRLELDKTLRRDRRGGVVIDMSTVTSMSGAVSGRLLYFTRCLKGDAICALLVVDTEDTIPIVLPCAKYFDAIVPSIDIAEEILDVSFK